jgi:hypothetical protein
LPQATSGFDAADRKPAILNQRKSAGLALVLALSLLIVGVPVVTTPASADQGPSLTLDICHSAQALGTASIQCSLPLLPSATLECPPEFSVVHKFPALLFKARLSDPPEAPPPKLRVFLAN